MSEYLLLMYVLHALSEAITVAIDFKNPLQIPVSISSASLTCEHSAQSDEMKPGKSIDVSLHAIYCVLLFLPLLFIFFLEVQVDTIFSPELCKYHLL